MKKIIIAGASAVLAAMPVVGAFATSTSFTDSLQVGVAGGCTMQNSQDTTAGDYSHSNREFSNDIAAGTVGYLNATDATTEATTQGTVTISCNTSDSTKTYTVTVAVEHLTDGSHPFTGGDATSGTASVWAIKSNAEGTTASNPFANYTAAASTTFLTATANNSVTFNPSYQVYVAPAQAPGTYNGSATYTINLPN